MKYTSIRMTKHQMKQAQPFLDQAKTAYLQGEPGAVFSQVNERGKILLAFIPYKYALRILDILEEAEKNEIGA